MEDEYTELVVAAHDALHELLLHTAPGTGITLHHAVADLKRMCEKAEAETLRRQTQEVGKQRMAEYRESRARWLRVSDYERQRHIVEALGDDRLTVRELHERLAERLPEASLYESGIRSLLTRMLAAGEIDRAEETFHSKPRYRYFRKALSGEIAMLDATIEGGERV